MRGNRLEAILKKVKLSHLLSVVLVFIKTLGGFLFSWFLIYFKGDFEHVNILKDLSAIIGLSIFIRFGADAVLLKLATRFYALNSKIELFHLLLTSSFLCLVNSFVLFLILSLFYSFETVSVSQAIIISLLVSLNFCLASFLKSFGRINSSFISDAGMVMFLSLPFIFFWEFNAIIFLGFAWGVVLLIYLVYITTIIFEKGAWKKLRKTKPLYKEFFIPLPNLFLNSVINYLQQWGIIYLSTFSLSVGYASSFILIIRSSYIFNAVLSPLASYTVPEVIRRFDNGGAISVNTYIKKIRPLYKYSSILCFIIASLFSVVSVYPELMNTSYVLSFILFLFCCAFNVASGPVNMYMAVLGYEKLLIKVRIIIIVPFIIFLYFSAGNMFIVTCAIYIFLQRLSLVFFLRKKSGINSI